MNIDKQPKTLKLTWDLMVNGQGLDVLDVWQSHCGKVHILWGSAPTDEQRSYAQKLAFFQPCIHSWS